MYYSYPFLNMYSKKCSLVVKWSSHTISLTTRSYFVQVINLFFSISNIFLRFPCILRDILHHLLIIRVSLWLLQESRGLMTSVGRLTVSWLLFVFSTMLSFFILLVSHTCMPTIIIFVSIVYKGFLFSPVFSLHSFPCFQYYILYPIHYL